MLTEGPAAQRWWKTPAKICAPLSLFYVSLGKNGEGTWLGRQGGVGISADWAGLGFVFFARPPGLSAINDWEQSDSV
uniref:Uncharacterized protein n=1 Tax=Anguilla anguilla TaxID=7936 RepID=A0A0E9PNQ8_ANGAN